MPTLAILAACVLAAIAYGVLHDLVTAHLCLEYFTIGHPRLFETNDPIPHALAWGVIATWWVGVLLGVPLALAARAGSRAKVGLPALWRPLVRLLVGLGSCAAVAGALGYHAARNGDVVLLEPLASFVPIERHERFIAAYWMHLTSYGGGAIGGLALAARIWKRRVG